MHDFFLRRSLIELQVYYYSSAINAGSSGQNSATRRRREGSVQVVQLTIGFAPKGDADGQQTKWRTRKKKKKKSKPNGACTCLSRAALQLTWMVGTVQSSHARTHQRLKATLSVSHSNARSLTEKDFQWSIPISFQDNEQMVPFLHGSMAGALFVVSHFLCPNATHALAAANAFVVSDCKS